jgi:hypothetical protein
MVNYYPDVNKFNLAGPPDWWLRQLYTFDPSLAVVPSRQGFYYRLAQRRKLSLPEKMTQESLWHESDTQMLASYGLIPVTTILATTNWSNPYLFEELRRRSPHRLGGADKVTQAIEAQEAKEEAAKQALIDERNTYVAKDAWKLYLKKIGLRTHMYSPTVKQHNTVAEANPNRAPAIKIVNS